MCIVRSLHTDAINHDPAHTFMNTGSMIAGRPAMGSWLWYGLGNDAQSLPGFVVMVSTGQFRAEAADRRPAVAFGLSSQPVPGSRISQRRRSRCSISRIPPASRRNGSESSSTPWRRSIRSKTRPRPIREIATRISQYEMAFQMQTSVPELMDVRNEPKHILDLYGTRGGDGTFASNCLLARRLAERGVRFIQLYHRDWDHHGMLKRDIAGNGGGSRPRSGRAAHRLEAARHAGRHDRRFRLGVRPHADGPGERPRPPSGRFHHVVRRRRIQARASATGRPTNSAITRPKTARRSTTFTRLCCPRWGSTTCGSRSRTRGSTPA